MELEREGKEDVSEEERQMEEWEAYYCFCRCNGSDPEPEPIGNPEPPKPVNGL